SRHDKRFFIRQQYALTRFNGRHGWQQTRCTNDGCHYAIYFF
ncbi:hypothetical protein D043_2538B, partial [Vibrio parahaemolyticus EKP-021]